MILKGGWQSADRYASPPSGTRMIVWSVVL
jgi:hypothetical protein